ncbi:adenylosuccinate synthetase [Shigella flexneri]
MLITFWVSSSYFNPRRCRSVPDRTVRRTASSSASRVTNSAQRRRRRRTGWPDNVAVRRAVQLNSRPASAHELDVLDGLKEVKLCVAYRMPDGREVTTTPLAADDGRCRADLRNHAGWL